MKTYRLPDERIDQFYDAITLHVDGFDVSVRLAADREELSNNFQCVEDCMWGRLVVTVYQGSDLVLHEGNLLVRVPHRLHEFSVSWASITEQAHRLAHDNVAKVRKKLWEGLIG
jgi:hypothetical protein